MLFLRLTSNSSVCAFWFLAWNLIACEKSIIFSNVFKWLYFQEKNGQSIFGE
uniref:Uncharacterized protein n=1 Tax=Anguilla anguilla TaxID=7936 RepID=A0A0E9PH57_ANGAN